LKYFRYDDKRKGGILGEREREKSGKECILLFLVVLAKTVLRACSVMKIDLINLDILRYVRAGNWTQPLKFELMMCARACMLISLSPCYNDSRSNACPTKYSSEHSPSCVTIRKLPQISHLGSRTFLISSYSFYFDIVCVRNTFHSPVLPLSFTCHFTCNHFPPFCFIQQHIHSCFTLFLTQDCNMCFTYI
jgi:hypothetical protein